MLKVIAIGNSLRGDDGIGPAILDELQKHDFVKNVSLLDIGSDAFSLLDHLIQDDPVLIIDCARMGKKPGEIYKFEIDQSNLAWMDKEISLHGFSLSEIFQMAIKLSPVTRCNVIGIEPKTIEFNLGLSPEVTNSIPVVVQLVKEEINKYEEKNTHN